MASKKHVVKILTVSDARKRNIRDSGQSAWDTRAAHVNAFALCFWKFFISFVDIIIIFLVVSYTFESIYFPNKNS